MSNLPAKRYPDFRSCPTRWGLTQGLTAHARTLPFADRRVNLERRTGVLLS